MSLCVNIANVIGKAGAKSADGSGLHTENLKDQPLIAKSSEKAAYSGTKRLKVIRQVYGPGGTHLPHKHPHAEQAYFVESGSAHVRIGDEHFDVQGGTILYIPPNTEHEIKNTGSDLLVNYLIDVVVDGDES